MLILFLFSLQYDCVICVIWMKPEPRKQWIVKQSYDQTMLFDGEERQLDERQGKTDEHVTSNVWLLKSEWLGFSLRGPLKDTWAANIKCITIPYARSLNGTVKPTNSNILWNSWWSFVFLLYRNLQSLLVTRRFKVFAFFPLISMINELNVLNIMCNSCWSFFFSALYCLLLIV